MKRRFVAVLLSLCLILAFIPVSAMAVEFDDTQDHWLKKPSTGGAMLG